MQLTTILVGQPTDIGTPEKPVLSGIRKSSVAGPVVVNETHLTGDRQADLSVHGGRDKAVYAYSSVHYAYWNQEFGRDLPAGHFGENLVIDELNEADELIGSIWTIGTATFEIAQPRLPCFKLGLHVGDETFPARFLRSGRLGAYLRVIKTGEICAGQTVNVSSVPEHQLTVRRLWQIVFSDPPNAEHLKAAMALPYLDAGWQRRIRAKLKQTE